MPGIGVKFDQFLNGGPTAAGDEIVGLRNGQNYRFDAPIQGGATSFEMNIVQAAHNLAVGDVVRFDGVLYVLAQADVAANADVVGIVAGVVNANEFTILYGGYVIGPGPLVSGSVYFLDAAVAGAMTAVAPVVPGQVRKPLLIADSAVSGYWLNYNGQVL